MKIASAITLLVGTCLVVFVVPACDDSTGSSVNTRLADAGNSDAGNSDAGGRCCPAQATPGCCMDFGGWSSGGQCGSDCDGMPVADDPGWVLENDSHGCAVWRHPNDPFHGGVYSAEVAYCGGVVADADAGADSGTLDASSDGASP